MKYIKKEKRKQRKFMVVGFTFTYAISAYHHKSYQFESHSGGVYSTQNYVMVCLSVTWARSVVFSGYSRFLSE
jgi:cellobiose-specific phosphotransferase system component IIC